MAVFALSIFSFTLYRQFSYIRHTTQSSAQVPPTYPLTHPVTYPVTYPPATTKPSVTPISSPVSTLRPTPTTTPSPTPRVTASPSTIATSRPTVRPTASPSQSATSLFRGISRGEVLQNARIITYAAPSTTTKNIKYIIRNSSGRTVYTSQAQTAPYSLFGRTSSSSREFNSRMLLNGSYALIAEVTNSSGAVSREQIPFSVSNSGVVPVVAELTL